MIKKNDKQVRVCIDVYNAFIELCEKNEYKSIKSEIDSALLHFIKLGITPTNFNSNEINTIFSRLDKIDGNISAQNMDFRIFMNKSLDRQFGFLKEFEKYNLKKLDDLKISFTGKENKSSMQIDIDNLLLLNKLNVEAVLFVYDLMIDLVKIQLGAYDKSEFDDIEDMEDEEINETLYHNFEKHVQKIMTYFKSYEGGKRNPEEEHLETENTDE